MRMFTEDPTLPTGALLMAAVCCFVALKARGEGKYLVWGAAALALSGAVLAFEWLWVTDEERIEGVVYDVRRGVLAADAPAVLARLTPTAQYVQSESALTPEATRALIASNVAAAKFDVVRVHALQVSAGRQTRRGKAEFKVFVRGSIQGPPGIGGLSGATDTAWSLGFEETGPGVWKINRITPVSSAVNLASLSREVLRGSGPDPSSAEDFAPGDPESDDHRRGRGRGWSRPTRKTLARDRELQGRYESVAPDP